MSVPPPITNYRSLRAVSLLALGIALTIGGCRLGNPPPTRVESGLRYSSGQAEFDALFSEMYQLQTELYRAPDEERSLRRELAEKLEVTAGATPQVLVDTVHERARWLAEKKTFLRLVVEGFGAVDETDTLVQSTVSGPLDGPAKVFVESTTLLARLELKHAAQLRKVNKKLYRLTIAAQALEPSIEPNFSAQGYTKQEEVRRNLKAAQRALPLLSLQATDLADSSEQLVRKLSLAMTTDQTLTEKSEPPLIAPTPTPSPTKRTRATALPRRTNGNGAATPKPKSEAPGQGSSDFEP